MRHLMMKFLNPFMKWLLSSPFHRLVSGSYMLITVIGRKSGTAYTTPVQYKQQGDRLFVITSAAYKWWKNLQGGAEVTLHLRGENFTGYAETTSDEATIAEYIHVIYPSMLSGQAEQLLLTCIGIQIELAPEKMLA